MRIELKRAACALMTAGAIFLGGCGAPDGAGRDTISVVREDAGAEYNFVTARRGDISLIETVRVSYFAARQENYSFSASGLYYESFFVSVGDEVKAGDILATVESGELDAEISACQAEIAVCENNIARNQALLDLYNSRAKGEGPDARRRGYEVAIRDDKDAMAVAQTRLEELTLTRQSRVITAGIDGTVTFVRSVDAGETSVNGRTIITVTNLDSCAFTATTENPSAIRDGEIYTITIGGADYEITLATAEELGIEDEPMNEKSTRTRLYFRLLTPSVNLNDDSAGKFNVTVDSRKDVIYIPATAVTEINGATCVYVPDESGLRSVRPVSVGLMTNRYAEITDGLAEGENVIY